MTESAPTELERSLARRIGFSGPISVADFMSEALFHPRHGYYRHAAAIGRGGDFITAPEISQVFGELIGAWLAERWTSLGRPAPINLVELGPGRGTLLADALRVTRKLSDLQQALRIHLVEINPQLRAQQRDRLAAIGCHAIEWHEQLADVPAGPVLLVANEFFDALPVRQLQAVRGGWSERMIGVDPAGGLRFAVAPGPSPLAVLLPPQLASAQFAAGTVAEIAPQRERLMHDIAGRLCIDPGCALILDYGRAESGPGATLQAVRAHRQVDVLDRPGESDLSAHVDFAALVRTARAAGALAWGPSSQRHFLLALGIEARAAALQRDKSAETARDLRLGVDRLIDPAGMGTLFQAVAIGSPGSPAPAGFET